MKKCVELLQKPTMGVTCNSQNAIILENFFKRPWIKNGERFAVCSVISLTVQKASDVSGLSAGMAISSKRKNYRNFTQVQLRLFLGLEKFLQYRSYFIHE